MLVSTSVKQLYNFFYLLKNSVVGGKDGKIEGMVRVVTPANGHRALIRGKTNEVLDLQFAHMRSQVLLASIEATALHVHKIELNQDNIICEFVLKIDDPLVGYKPLLDRVHWCPYVPESETDAESDVGKILIWTRNGRLQCYNVEAVIDTYGVSSVLHNKSHCSIMNLGHCLTVFNLYLENLEGRTYSVSHYRRIHGIQCQIQYYKRNVEPRWYNHGSYIRIG